MKSRPLDSDLHLERAALGEVDRASLSPEQRARLEELERSNQAILEAYPAARMVPEIVRRAAQEGPRSRALFWRSLAFAAPVAAMAALALFVLPRASPDSPTSNALPDPAVRAKGGPELWVYKKTASGSERLEAGAAVRAGDLLQAGYVAGDARFGVILSIDGRSGVTLHWPVNAGETPSLLPGARVSLPSAYQLDDAPGYERFFFVSATDRFDVQPVLDAARRLAGDPVAARRDPLKLPGNLQQRSLLLEKERR